MKNKALWMARLLKAHGPMSKKEIREAWQEEDPDGKPMANSTFYDNLWALESRYGIHISRLGRRFRLEAASQNESDLYAQLFEQRQENTDHLNLLATQVEIEQAAIRHVKLQFDYQPPNKSGYRMTLWPYGLRQAGQWTYVTGWSERHNEVRTFALDRIRHLETTALKFTPPQEFNAAQYFRHSFGAFYRPGQTPEPLSCGQTLPLRATSGSGRCIPRNDWCPLTNMAAGRIVSGALGRLYGPPSFLRPQPGSAHSALPAPLSGTPAPTGGRPVPAPAGRKKVVGPIRLSIRK